MFSKINDWLNTRFSKPEVGVLVCVVIIGIIIMFIKVEETPNPDTLKFIPERELDLENNVFLNKNDDIKSYPLAEELFSIEGVKSILLDNDFISITKNSKESWEFLKTIITVSYTHLTLPTSDLV